MEKTVSLGRLRFEAQGARRHLCARSLNLAKATIPYQYLFRADDRFRDLAPYSYRDASAGVRNNNSDPALHSVEALCRRELAIPLESNLRSYPLTPNRAQKACSPDAPDRSRGKSQVYEL